MEIGQSPATARGRRRELIQGGGQAVQLGEMGLGQLGNQPVTLPGQAYPRYPAVLGVRAAADQAGRFRPVHQFHRAVMAQQEVTSEVADRWRVVPEVAFDGHQELVLDMREPGGPGLILAPMLKTSQADAES